MVSRAAHRNGTAARFAMITLIGLAAAGCALTIPVDPSAAPGSRLVLSFHGRGNTPVILRLGALEVARFGCNEDGELAPFARGVPPLPWDLQVVRQRDQAILASSRITSLPKVVLVIGSRVEISVEPGREPAGPACE